MEIYYCLLAEGGSCLLSEICSYMSIPKQTLNSQLRSMEKDGDIKVDYLPNSKKNKAAVLTEKGMKQARATAGLMQKFETKALTSFSQQEVEILFSLLERFTDEMIRFTIPTILTMIIGSVYGIIDGIIISTYVGKMVFPL